MKKCVWMLLLAAVVSMSNVAMAQDAPPPDSRPHDGGRGGDDPKARVEHAIKDMNLTDDQKAKVKAALDTFHESMQKLQASNEDLRKQLHEAEVAKDEAKVKELRAKLEAARAPVAEALRKQLTDAVGEDKAKTIVAAMTPGRPGGDPHIQLLEKLGLTDDQKAKVKEIMEKAHKDAQAATTEDQKRAIGKAAFDKIKTDVLTKDQVEKFNKLWTEREIAGRLERFQALNLTDDQKAKVKEILTKAFQDAQAAGTDEQKREINKAAMDKIRTDVLTDAQREQLKKQHEERGGSRPNPRPEGAVSK